MNTATLSFSREAIIYDIENYAYIVADSIIKDEEHAKHQVLDIAQEGNIDRVTRMVNIAFAKCVEMLYPYTKNECGQQEYYDNSLVGDDVLLMSLSLPEGFSRTTLDFVSKLIHEYIVYCVMADWLSLTYPALSAVWRAKQQEAEQDIRTRLNARCGRIRRTQTPF